VANDRHFEEVIKEITQKQSAINKENEKKLNDYLVQLAEISEYKKLTNYINQQLSTENAQINIAEKKLHEINNKEFNKSVEQYNSRQKSEIKSESKKFEESDQKKITATTALDLALKSISDKRKIILDSMGESKSLWKESFDKSIQAQAEHFATRDQMQMEVKKITNDFVTSIKDNIATYNDNEKNVVKIKPLSQTELDTLESASDKARKEALETLQEQLALYKEGAEKDPKFLQNLQIKYAGTVVNAAIEMNKEIDKLNKDRPKEQQIPKISTSVKKAIDFVNNVEGLPTQDAKQIMDNMLNFLLLEGLKQQETELRNTAKNVTNANQNKKTACELQSTSPKNTYDPDSGTRYAIKPNQVTMAHICLEINKEKGNQKLTVMRDADPRYLKFENGDENFRYNKETGIFTADKVSPATLQIMSEVMKRAYNDKKDPNIKFLPTKQNEEKVETPKLREEKKPKLDEEQTDSAESTRTHSMKQTR